MNDTARRILIVDDDERVRTLLSWRLEAEGFTVRCTADGGEALERIDVECPDLVVLDLPCRAWPAWMCCAGCASVRKPITPPRCR